MGLLSIKLFVGQLVIALLPLGLLFQSPLPALNPKHILANTRNLQLQVDSNISQLAVSVPEISRQVTVRILTNPGAGSGVIITRQGQIYTVLTNEHVVADTWDNLYTIQTTDEQKHPARRLHSIQFGNIDLALVQFTSSNVYRVAEIGDSDALCVGPVYASGFSNWYWLNLNAKNTRDWGMKAFKLTTGQVGMLLPTTRSLYRGYRLGYTNDIENGMSGGPVLDSKGRLIGINGRLKYPFQGISAFIFTDGTLPSEELFQQMEALSWAIPIATFQKIVGWASVARDYQCE